MSASKKSSGTLGLQAGEEVRVAGGCETSEARIRRAAGVDRQGRAVYLRPAQLSDGVAIWRWRQDMDPAFARAPRSPSLDENMRWISAALQDPDRFLYILEEGETEDGEGAAAGGGAGNGDQPPGRPLGHIRLDRVGENAMVSIILAPEERGRGLGRVVLKSIESSAMESGFHTILAEIHISNIASLRTFLAAGYVETGMRGDFAQLSREILQTG